MTLVEALADGTTCLPCLVAATGLSEAQVVESLRQLSAQGDCHELSRSPRGRRFDHECNGQSRVMMRCERLVKSSWGDRRCRRSLAR